MKREKPSISLGLRVNPRYSEIETLLYNPCAPGSRFGVTREQLPETLPSDIEGFHCHCHCEWGRRLPTYPAAYRGAVCRLVPTDTVDQLWRWSSHDTRRL